MKRIDKRDKFPSRKLADERLEPWSAGDRIPPKLSIRLRFARGKTCANTRTIRCSKELQTLKRTLGSIRDALRCVSHDQNCRDPEFSGDAMGAELRLQAHLRVDAVCKGPASSWVIIFLCFLPADQRKPQAQKSPVGMWPTVRQLLFRIFNVFTTLRTKS
ncbi:uncharacterized protein LOC111925989 isoform X2 [Cyanistes caeruleus]|uniref:uncharacterized protein LOC111925989 isoform X2 n=1 Tax=Cyanistes caeruleus TaxID=156563 RepID=UPI000CDAEC23|nr:uncharacterized protein LOC111925989 isoform X2 [Cyanistes caeruleus]